MPTRVPTLIHYIHRRPDPDSRQAHRRSATKRRLLSCPVIPPPSSPPSNRRSEQTRTGWMTEKNRTRNAWRAADCGRTDKPPLNGGGPSEKWRPAPQNRNWRTADAWTATTADFSADWPWGRSDCWPAGGTRRAAGAYCASRKRVKREGRSCAGRRFLSGRAAADARGAQRRAERQVCWDVGAEERWGRSPAGGRPGSCIANQSENRKIIVKKYVYPSERRWIFLL